MDRRAERRKWSRRFLGSVDFVAREVIKAEDVRDYTRKTHFAERLARQLGAASGETLLSFLSQVRLR